MMHRTSPSPTAYRPDDLPPGHRTNPSAHAARIPVAALAFAGLLIAGYLALYQYHHIGHVWDPIFGDGSHKVLTSKLSRMLPVSDASLGAAAYLIETILELAGGTTRWRDRPYLVLLTTAVAAALALTGVGLVISQPLLTGTFCTLCLTSAGLSWIVLALVTREARAAVGRVRKLRQQG
jgi:uncharacterized membrane protein